MVRDNRVSVGFNNDEYDKICERAKEAHLKITDYIRWYLFSNHTVSSHTQAQQTPQVTIPYKAAPKVVERIKEGKKVYVDPYQKARLDTMNTFKKGGGLGELHNSIRMMAHGGKVLKKIPKKIIKEREKQKEERKVVVNKALDEIKKKYEELGISTNE